MFRRWTAAAVAGVLLASCTSGSKDLVSPPQGIVNGKVAYATKAEHDFQRPAEFDPRGYANRIPWQLGDPVDTAEVWIPEDVLWYVELH